MKGPGAVRAKTKDWKRRGQNSGMSLCLGFCRGQWKSSLFLSQPALTIVGKAFLAHWSVSVVLASMRQGFLSAWICNLQDPQESLDLLCRVTRAALWHHIPPPVGWVSEPRCRLGGFNDRGHLSDGSCVLALSHCKRAGESRKVLCSCCHCRYSGAASGATGASCDLELMYFWCVVSCPVLTRDRWGRCSLTSSVGQL